MKTINLTMKDYKRMRKIIKNDHKSYQYTIDIEDREYPYDSKEFWMLKMVKALNIKDLQLRFEYIYKEMCDILDNISHKVCDFNCDKCYGNRSGKCFAKINGCCYFHKKPCPYLVNGVCQHRSISCKIFLCEPIEKKYHFKSKVDTYPLLKNFFNWRQKNVIHYSYRQEMDDVVAYLLLYAKNLKE